MHPIHPPTHTVGHYPFALLQSIYIYIYIYKTLRYVSVQGSAVSGLQSETEPINTKSVMQHVIRYQVLLAAYYKADTSIVAIVQKRRQFPIRLAFSMTINKSQGQAFDKICLYLLKPIFSHLQLYVVLSRVRSLGSLSAVSETNETVNCLQWNTWINK
jgi:hypothetical protein